MTVIQLEGFGWIDVDTNTSFPLNFNVQNVMEPESTPSSYSKDIILPGTKQNNKVLGQAFDINISNSSFNVNQRVRCTVTQNGTNVFEEALFQLIAVNKTGKTLPNGDDEIFYVARVKSSTMSFFTDIKGKELRDLSLFTQADYEILNKTNIFNSFTNDVTDRWKYITHFNGADNTIFTVKDFRPAIFAKVYWDAIHEQSGWEYEFDEIEELRFDKLVIPSTEGFDPDGEVVERGTVRGLDNTFYQYDFLCRSQYFPTNNPPNLRVQQPILVVDPRIAMTNLIQDEFNQFNTTNSNITAEFTTTYNIKIEMDYDHVLNNPLGINVYLDGESGNKLEITHQVNFRKISSGGIFLGQFKSSQGITSVINVNDELVPGNTTIASGTVVFEANIPMSATNILSQVWLEQIWSNITDATNQLRWRPVGSTTTTQDICSIVNVNSTRVVITPELDYNWGTPIYLNDFVPRGITQRDFVKSIIDAFKLIVEVDPNQDNKLIYKTRDKYYDDGDEVNWTNKLAKDKQIKLEWIQDKQPKRQYLTYKQDSDVVNVGYEANTKDVYGQYDFRYENEYNFGDDKIEVVFSPTPILKNPFTNMYLPAITGEPEKAYNIRLLYDNGLRTDAYYFFQNEDGTIPSTPELDYCTALHLDDPLNPSYDINFGQCAYYFYNDWDNMTQNNLFNLYHRRFYSQLTNGRIMTAFFYLTPTDILNFKLNQKVFIKDTWYNVNRIVDYNANSEQLTKVELVTVDDLQALTPILPPRPTKPNPTKPIISEPISLITKEHINLNNTTVGSNTGVILGRNNVVSSDFQGIIVGDGKSVIEDGVYVNETSITDGEININNDVIITSEELITPSDFLINNTPIDEIVTEDTDVIKEVTRAELIALRNSNDLLPGWVYYITDRDIFLKALETGVIGTQGRRKMRLPLTTFYTPQTVSGFVDQVYTGIYGQGIAAGSYPNSSFTFGGTVYYAIWGGKMWERNSSGADGTPPNDFTLNSTGWTLLPETDATRYETKYFSVEYDLDGDVIINQTDWKGNIIRNQVVSGFNTVDRSDWNNDLIVNNITNGIYNNWRNSTTRALILNNNINGRISFNRKNGQIRANTNIGDIINNTGGGEISNNSNIGSINSNSNSSNIVNNSNSGSINLNSNNGSINLNSNNGLIINNSNTSNIERNTNNGDIQNNSNDGSISVNRNNNHITANSNNGPIVNNSNNGIILNNSNNGPIINNINNGVIQNNTPPTTLIQDTTVNK